MLEITAFCIDNTILSKEEIICTPKTHIWRVTLNTVVFFWAALWIAQASQEISLELGEELTSDRIISVICNNYIMIII